MTEFKPEGRNCITRNGQMAKWVAYHDDDDYPLEFMIDGDTCFFKRSGRYRADESKKSSLDLVRYADEPEKPKGPVVTETVKRIVPGRYGVITVANADGPTVAIKLPNAVGEYQRFTAAELRAAAATLIELADALSSDGGE